MITKINQYYLAQPLTETKELREFTDEEYKTSALAGIRRMLMDEKIFNAHTILFQDQMWEPLIASTKGVIYKIALLHTNTDHNQSEIFFNKMLDYL